MDTKNLITPQVIVVEASAGAGKTYALAKRYLQIIMNPKLPIEDIPLKSILAITFTNKAMVEMKERILELLKKIIFDSFNNQEEEKDILGFLSLSKKSAQEKALVVMDELIKNYSFFQIQTIDSFINSLLLGCALHIDRSASFKIKTDYRKQLEYCLDNLIDQASNRKDLFLFFKDFLEHYLFVENQHGWFPRNDILDLMQSLFKLVNKYGQLFKEYPGSSKDLLKEKEIVFKKLQELFETAPEGINKTFMNSLEKFLNNQASIFEINSLPLALTRKTVPMNKKYSSPQEFEDLWLKINQMITKIVEKEATTVYNPYIKIFKELLAIFYANSKKEDILFLEELNHTAGFLFSSEGISVAEVYYRLSARFNHYLIDEFQDTSLLQWQNLKIMVEEALSNGGSLFYVGDKKQAIYRFRGGEPKLFDQIKTRFTHFNIDHKKLEKNWRSQKAIVDFNNYIFSKANLSLALENIPLDFDSQYKDRLKQQVNNIFSEVKQVYHPENDAGYVSIERILEKNKNELNLIMEEKLIELIRNLETRFSLEDITILTRDNDELEIITNWLFKVNISVASEKTLNLLENNIIKELISFLKFLSSPIDNLNFANFILGEIFTTLTNQSQKQMETFLLETYKQKTLGLDLSLYNVFRKHYPKFWQEYIENFFKISGLTSVYELVISIYSRFKLLENFKDSQAFLMKFLEIIKSKEEEYSSLTNLLEYIQDLQDEKIDQRECYINATNTNAVKILTVHKAKGLEFPVVIIPFLRMDISAETGGRRTSSYIEHTKNNIGLLRITKAYRQYSSFLEDIYSQAYENAFIDELNLIYVALTRPQYELYLFIPEKNGVEKNKANYLIPLDKKEYGSKKEYSINKKDKKDLSIFISDSKLYDWVKGLRDELPLSLGQDNQKLNNYLEIKEGEIIHKLLSFIPKLNSQQENDIIEKAIEKVSPFYQLKDKNVYREKLKKIISAPSLKKIFFLDAEEVFCEKEIINHFGDSKRIDRLIIGNDWAWVIDYKTSAANSDKQIKQVLEYIDIIAQIYPSKKISGFILYLDKLDLKAAKEA